MSDITPMAAVPSEVNYGRIRANFVAFIADDNGNVLEEVPLEGNVILTPTVGVLRFPSTSPPRTAVIQTLQCPVIGGILYPPGTPLGGPFPSQTGVAAVASDQPAGLPTTVQWTASFSLENTSAQPNPVTFEVPSGGVVDLTTVMPATPEPGIVVVVSTESRDRAEGAAATATQRASAAASSATAAATSASAAASSASNAASSAASISWAGLPGKPAVIAAGATAADARTAIGAADAEATALKDTGWRNIANLLNTAAWELNPSNGYLRLKRAGSRVTLAGRVKAISPVNEAVVILPPGFRQFNAHSAYGAARLGSTRTLLVAVAGLEYMQTLALPTVGATLEFEVSFETGNPFPTTRPGTPNVGSHYLV